LGPRRELVEPSYRSAWGNGAVTAPPPEQFLIPGRSGDGGQARRRLLTALGLLASLGACASGPALPRCDLSPTAAARLDGYQLGPGDQLQVTVFRHEPLSGEFTLGATGMVAMPLVGGVAADGLTTRELELAIENQLRQERYLVDPDVSIQVLTYRPFYILGRSRSLVSTSTSRG
jgi:polysaccharide export outer membrane protein